MKSSVKKLPGSQIEAIIDIDQIEFEVWHKKALKKLAEKAKMPGFREGKVPVEKIQEKIGEHAILAEVLDLALPKWYQQLIEENKLRPVSEVQPEIQSTDPLRIKLVFSVWPDIELGDSSKLKVKKVEAKVSQEDVDKEIQAIIQGNIEWIEVDRAAKNEDKVELDFTGYDKEDNKLPNAESQNHPLILGENTMIPGFEENIVGMKAGEEKDFDIKFPGDYHSEKMRGQKTRFHVKVNQVFEKKVPEWNDELADKVTQGRSKQADDLKKEIEKVLFEHRTRLAQQQYEADIISALAEKSRLEVPQILVDRVLEQMVHNFQHDIQNRGLSWDQYLQHHKMTEEELREKWKDSAQKRAREELVLQAYGEENDIKVDDQDVNKEIEHMINHIQSKEEQKKALDHYSKPEAREHIAASIRLRQTIKRLIKAHEEK